MLASKTVIGPMRPGRFMQAKEIAVGESVSAEFTEAAYDLHFLPPEPDSPAPSVLDTPRSSLARLSISDTLHTLTQASSPRQSPPAAETHMTFDTFMLALDASPESKASSAPSINFEAKYGMRVSIVKREATNREKLRQLRHKAAAKIQRWYLQVRGTLLQRRQDEERRNARLKEIASHILQSRAALRISKAIGRFAARRRTAKLEIVKKYRNMCAVLIQKRYRGYIARKHFAGALAYKRRFAVAYMQGLKVRRVLRRRDFRLLRQQLIQCDDSAQRGALKADFQSRFAQAMKAPWRPKPVTKLYFPVRSRGRKETTPVETIPRATESSAESTAVSQRNPSLVLSLTRNARQKSAGTVRKLTFSVSAAPATTQKPMFLQRQTACVVPHKLNWRRVKSRIDCWGSPKAKKPQVKSPSKSIEEFQKIEKEVRASTSRERREKRKIPIPVNEEVLKSIAESVEDRESLKKSASKALEDSISDSAGTTEAQSDQSKPASPFPVRISLIPRFTCDSAFVAGLRRIEDVKDYAELRALLQEAYAIMRKAAVDC